MRMPLPTRALGRAVAAVAAAVTLLSVSAGPVSAGTTDGPGFQQPSVGECRDLDLAQAMKRSDITAPIDCTDPHTVRVVAVGRLPRGLDWDDAAAKLDTAVVNACQPAVDKALGGTASLRDMSAYIWWWFIPTQIQRAHGARWFRCDLSLFGGTRMLRLPTDETPALDGPPAAGLGGPLPHRADVQPHHVRASTRSARPGRSGCARTRTPPAGSSTRPS